METNLNNKLPEKEDKCKCFRLGEGSKWQTYNCEIHNENLNECLEIVDKKSYTIEEIEKAINGVKLVHHYDEILKIIKKQILNNLKELTKQLSNGSRNHNYNSLFIN